MTRAFAITAVLLALTTVAAMGFEPMTATVRVSSGQLYDYVVLAEHQKATDGFDNAYDIISPGNLNADMGEPFISAVVSHPEWRPARELRGDTRPPAKQKQWDVSITTSLPKGTPLVVGIVPEQSQLPKQVRVSAKEGNRQVELTKNEYILSAPGPGSVARLQIVAEQP
ncbi:hypothetical protein KP004_06030 [Geomonas oryzisoli]|uniref:Uncharacterized protein n=1 Tax=Geomonas oryzisoli TaxID=2847992 RepID=A0ABX8J8F8_9BACT|nr:hypothetical protein [Geomonas oryzisoli]QWV94733.1 hypothetical protein KP004_06030 [Geomonas oryzisoli]